MTRPFDNNRTKRLGLAAGLALVLALAAAPAATAGWVTAGNGYVRAQSENTAACSDGVQTRLAAYPFGFQGQNAFFAFYNSHPFAWARIRVTDETAPNPDAGVNFADEVMVLPRNPVDTGFPWSNGIPGSNVFAYSAEVQIKYHSLLTGLVQMWASIEPLTNLFGPLGPPLQIPAAGCVLTPRADVNCLGARATITGTDRDDVLIGTPGNDVIAGGRGDDIINGLGGDDLLCGGDGEDTILGGLGHDGLDGGTRADILYAGFGNDLLLGGQGDDTMSGSFGDDIVKGEAGDDLLSGGAGLDIGTFDPIDGGTGTDACFQGDLLVSCP